MTRTKPLLIFFILALLAEFTVAETTSIDVASPDVENSDLESSHLETPHLEKVDVDRYSDWYQVEIIVFKLKRPATSDELWPEEDFSYPGNMISVSALNPDEITPYSLSQLQSLFADPDAIPGLDSELPPPANVFPQEEPESLNENQQIIETSDQDRITPDPSPVQASAVIEETESEVLETNIEADVEAEAETIVDAEVELEVEPELDFAQADALLDSALPKAYRALPKDSLTLGAIARSLRRSSKYDVAMHKAWLQPIISIPSPILLQTGDRYDDLFEIDGTLSISRSRYLHVQADLWFTQFGQIYDQSQLMLRQTDEFTEIELGYPELIKVEQNRDTFIAIQAFPLHHSRRMRSSTLHYIDHPYFGILIKIEKFTYSS